MFGDDEVRQLLERARHGDERAIGELFTAFRERLKRLVAFRLDDRLRARVDPSDVIQEAQLEVYARLPQYLAGATLPFYVWLRLEVGKHLAMVHRTHLGTQGRDVRREVDLNASVPDPSSDALVEAILARDATPSQEAVRGERAVRVRAALASLDALDREVITLRHFEMLSRTEVALTLGISEDAAGKRHSRALLRLARALRDLPGGMASL